MRLNRYRPRTERVYVDWIKRFVRFHWVRYPQEMGAEQVKAFLSHLATEMNVAASTPNQAFSALLGIIRMFSIPFRTLAVSRKAISRAGRSIAAAAPRSQPLLLAELNVRDVIVPIQSFQAPTLINFLSRRLEPQSNAWELRT